MNGTNWTDADSSQMNSIPRNLVAWFLYVLLHKINLKCGRGGRISETTQQNLIKFSILGVSVL